jgi:hypothetical protein
MKLKDVVIAYDDKTKKVEVVTREESYWDSASKHISDPSDYNLSNLSLFFLEMFTNLTAGEEHFHANPRQVYEEFCKIDEYDALDDEAAKLIKPKALRKVLARERKWLDSMEAA